jgi:hypothetical protein
VGHKPSRRDEDLSVSPQNLGDLCLACPAVGPDALADAAIVTVDGEQRWGIRPDAPASIDDPRGELGGLLVVFPTRLGTLAAAQLAAIGTLLVASVPAGIGISSLGRSVVEACGTIAWLLDDNVSSDVRHRRAWLLWAVSEGEAARTADNDAGRTGAMSGSRQRLADIEAELHDRLGIRIDRPSEQSQPRSWRLGDTSLPGRRKLVVNAVSRFFASADAPVGNVLYGQVSRDAHSDLLTALGRVDDRLRIAGGEGLDFVSTALAFWGLTWNHVLSYLGIPTPERPAFDRWLAEMLVTIGRPDLAGR